MFIRSGCIDISCFCYEAGVLPSEVVTVVKCCLLDELRPIIIAIWDIETRRCQEVTLVIHHHIANVCWVWGSKKLPSNGYTSHILKYKGYVFNRTTNITFNLIFSIPTLCIVYFFKL